MTGVIHQLSFILLEIKILSMSSFPQNMKNIYENMKKYEKLCSGKPRYFAFFIIFYFIAIRKKLNLFNCTKKSLIIFFHSYKITIHSKGEMFSTSYCFGRRNAK